MDTGLNELSQHKPKLSKKKKAQIENLLIRTLQIMIVIMILLVWEFGVKAGWIKSFLFASPSLIWNLLIDRAVSGTLWLDIGVTGLETITGFILGSIIGSFLGLGLWYSKFMAKLTQPFILAVGSIPILALGPLIIIWFGTGMFSKIVLAALSCVVVALLTTFEGAQQVDKDLLNLMSSFGASKRKIFTKIVVPSSMTWVVSAFKLNIGFALIGAIIGEYISSDKGLGHMILVGGSNFSIDVVLAGVVTLMIIAFALNFLVGYLEKSLLGWKNQKR